MQKAALMRPCGGEMSKWTYQPDAAARREDSSGDFSLVAGLLGVIGLFAFAIFCFVMFFLRP